MVFTLRCGPVVKTTGLANCLFYNDLLLSSLCWVRISWFVQFIIIHVDVKPMFVYYERDWLLLAWHLYRLVGVWQVPLMGRSSKQTNTWWRRRLFTMNTQWRVLRWWLVNYYGWGICWQVHLDGQQNEWQLVSSARFFLLFASPQAWYSI